MPKMCTVTSICKKWVNFLAQVIGQWRQRLYSKLLGFNKEKSSQKNFTLSGFFSSDSLHDMMKVRYS